MMPQLGSIELAASYARSGAAAASDDARRGSSRPCSSNAAASRGEDGWGADSAPQRSTYSDVCDKQRELARHDASMPPSPHGTAKKKPSLPVVLTRFVPLAVTSDVLTSSCGEVQS